MIRPIIHRRVRHVGLHEALNALDETHKPQPVEVPVDVDPHYFQKYAHMLAARSGMKVATRVLRGRGPAYMFVTERA
jgi:hypothetical protein